MYPNKPYSKAEIYGREAKIIKLNKPETHSTPNTSTLSLMSGASISDFSFQSTSSGISSSSSNDEYSNCEFIKSKLVILNSYKSKLNYGDISVKRGEIVFLLCDLTQYYYLVENIDGKQGFIPKEICIDAE
jgi:hypothetical protein